MGPVTGVTIVDPYTVRINLSEPWPILLAMLRASSLCPRTILKKNGSTILLKTGGDRTLQVCGMEKRRTGRHGAVRQVLRRLS